MAYPENFLREHGSTIITIMVVLLAFLTGFQMLGISFAEPTDEVIDKVVTIETMDQRDDKKKTDPSEDTPKLATSRRGLGVDVKPQWAGSACAVYSSQPHQLEAYCTNLSDSGCAAMDCCVWINGERCAAGDSAGPTFHNVDVKYFRFKKKCTGNCPAKIE
jgi:hypothetical protein